MDVLFAEGQFQGGAGVFEEGVGLAVGGPVRRSAVDGNDEIALADALQRRLTARIHLVAQLLPLDDTLVSLTNYGRTWNQRTPLLTTLQVVHRA